MKLYTINDDFIRRIKQIEPKIQDNYQGTRPYIGVLLNINGLKYFAPFSSYKPKQDRINNITVFKIHEKGNPDNKLGVIHLNNMFPVPDDQLTDFVIDIKTPYGRMVQNQYEYILHYQANIIAQAAKLYERVSKGHQFLSSLSCDFKRLEENYQV